MTNEEFQSKMEDAMFLFAYMIPEDLFIDSETVIEETATEEAIEETDEEAVEGEEIDPDPILGEVSILIDEFHIVTVIDKNTLFLVSTNGKTSMTIKVAGETITFIQLMSGILSKHNEVKEMMKRYQVLKHFRIYREPGIRNL